VVGREGMGLRGGNVLNMTPKVFDITGINSLKPVMPQGEKALRSLEGNESDKFILVRVNCLKELINNQNQLIRIIKS
jgi:hypothetical protein